MSEGAVASYLDARSPFRWWVAIYALVRRGAVDKGDDPAQIERELDERVANVVAKVSSRLLGEDVPMRLLETHELRRIAKYVASRIDASSTRHDHYPDGWRAELAFVLPPEPAPAREPGDDADG